MILKMKKFGEALRTNREAFVTEIKRRTQYFNDNSSLRGVGHVISLSQISMCKRLFWLVTFVACCFGSVVVLRGSLSLYTEAAVSYSVETDYLNWDTSFPAITLCEQLNETKAQMEFIKKNVSSSLFSFGKDVAFWNVKYCRSCADCKINITCIEDYMRLVEIARTKCEELMTDCWYNEEYFPCCERFKPIETEYGICYVFNSLLTGDGDTKVNRKVGLPTLKFSVLWSVAIRIHSPEETTSVASENILGSCNILHRISNFDVNLVAEEVVNEMSVRSILPENRDCLFKDEVPGSLESWPFSEYSYSACAWYCRIQEQIRLCNCTHHFMPKINQVPVCDVQGLRCLGKNFKALRETNVGNCNCPMCCDEVTYKVVDVSCDRLELTKELEFRGTQGLVKIGQLPHMRVRRHAIRSLLGLVVDVGGVVGVFFGASLLSFIEIAYIFCMRRYR